MLNKYSESDTLSLEKIDDILMTMVANQQTKSKKINFAFIIRKRKEKIAFLLLKSTRASS